MRSRKLLLLLILPFLTVSCWDVNDYDDFGVEPFEQSWVFPIMNSEISFKEMVERSGENTTVEENDDVTGHPNLYYMAIRDTVDAGFANNQFSLTDLGFNYNVTLDKANPSKSFPVEFEYSDTYDVVEGQEVDHVVFYDGDIQLEITNNFNHTIDLTVNIKSLKEDGNSLTIQRENFTAGSSIYESHSLDENWELDLHDGENYNTFVVTFTINSSESIGSFTGNLTASMQFNTLDYEEIWGKFNKDFNVPDQVFTLSAFNSTVLAEQYFANPVFTLNFDNSYGIPLSINFPTFEASNNQGDVEPILNDPDYVLGENDLNLSDYNIIDRVEAPDEPAVKTSLTLNSTNSNVDDIFRIAPNKIAFGVDFSIGDDTDNHDYFISRSSSVCLATDIVVPLDGWAVTHLLADTIMDVPWPDIAGDIEYLEDDYEATLKFKMTNELPLNMRFSVITLAEETLQPVDTLQFNSEMYDDGTFDLVVGADVDADGVLVEPSVSYLTITLTPEEFDRLKASPHIILNYRLFTHEQVGSEDPEPVKILSTNNLRTQLSVGIKTTVNLDNL
ncbi:MAG: hypothetical protein ACLFNU_03620 [Bacteroidales bacterium]